MHNHSIEEIKGYASGKWLEIIRSLAPELSEACDRPGQHVKCSCHGSHDGFRMYPDAAQTGGGYCNLEGGFADGISLLMWANRWDFKQTVEAIESHLGIADGHIPQAEPIQKPEPKPEKDWSIERQRLQAIWDATEPDNGRIVEYFQHRGLDIEVPLGLRLHPSLGYYHQGPPVKYPAMIARIQRDDETVGLHLTYLDVDGPGKAPVSQPRKIRKCVENISGGAIRLFEPVSNMPLALTEGIESALAVRDISGFPVWACGNSSLLSKVIIPENVRSIYVGADNDQSEAGKRAAQKLAQRLWDESGRGAIISFPPIPIPDGESSVDWLDYVAQRQEVACE
ncbi:MAG: toprim domain-containing protein [Nitrospinae bacterium]|nr:toprim domain-containing protein [Nitrospinota bacterium]